MKRTLWLLMLLLAMLVLSACAAPTEEQPAQDANDDTTAPSSNADNDVADPDAMTFSLTSTGTLERSLNATDADVLVNRADPALNVVFRDGTDFVLGLNFADASAVEIGEYSFDDTFAFAGSFSASDNDERYTGTTTSGSATLTEFGEEISGTFELTFDLNSDGSESVTVNGSFANVPVPPAE